MTKKDAKRFFTDGRNIALVGGAVSGNLTTLDFDRPDLFQLFLDMLEGVDSELRAKLTVWQETPSGGHHLPCRCSGPVGGSRKLAMAAPYQDDQGVTKNDTLIETKGEGGYFLIEPSRAVPKGGSEPKPYILHGDLKDIPLLSPEEVDLIHTIAQSFDEAGDVERSRERAANESGDRPGDWFNQNTDWHTLLNGYGWSYMKQVGDWEHWCRPGKTGETKATLHRERGLYVFSTSTPLPSQKPLDKFGVFAWYEHSGDFAAAAKVIRLRMPREVSEHTLEKDTVLANTLDPAKLLEAFEVKRSYVERLGKEEFLIPNLLIRQHTLVIVAMSGGGKTTFIFRYVAPELAKQGLTVWYCDADSPPAEHKAMKEIADKHGFRFLNADANEGTSIEGLKKTLRDIADSSADLTNWVFIFDTLKKFADLMQKNAVKQFFALCRTLASRGASIILLAHANKFRSPENHLIPEGTGDVRSDADDLIIFERSKNSNGGIDVTTVIDPDRNAKVRGVFKPFSFHISPEREISFYKQPISLTDHTQTAAPKATDEEILDAATEFLEETAAPVVQSALVARVCDVTGAGQRRVRGLIAANSAKAGSQVRKRFWFTTLKHGRMEYTLPMIEKPVEQTKMFIGDQGFSHEPSFAN